jgi:hypothetical protein
VSPRLAPFSSLSHHLQFSREQGTGKPSTAVSLGHIRACGAGEAVDVLAKSLPSCTTRGEGEMALNHDMALRVRSVSQESQQERARRQGD